MLPNFMSALEQLGKTNDERAAHLEMTGRRLENWKHQGPPRLLRVLVRHPELLSALLSDAKDYAKEAAPSP